MISTDRAFKSAWIGIYTSLSKNSPVLFICHFIEGQWYVSEEFDIIDFLLDQ
jgi:hypothetical protein